MKPGIEESQFVITSELNLYSERFENQINKGQTEEDFIASTESFKRLLKHYEILKALLSQRVKIRVITEKEIFEDPGVRSKIKELGKNRGVFKFKFTKKDVPLCMAIIDKKTVNFQISDELVPNFWSNNTQILKIASGYFEWLWSKTK